MKEMPRSFATHTIFLTPNHLCCAHFVRGAHKPLALTSFQTTTFCSLEVERGVLYNPTALDATISGYLQSTKQPRDPVAWALAAPVVAERLDQEVLDESGNRDEAEHILSEKQSLFYHHVTHKRCTYVCTIPHPTLFQYQLLAIRLKLNVTIFTTYRAALLALYRYRRGVAFHSTQLSLDMYKHQNIVEGLFDREDLFHLVELPQSVNKTLPTGPLLVATGLALMQGGQR